LQCLISTLTMKHKHFQGHTNLFGTQVQFGGDRSGSSRSVSLLGEVQSALGIHRVPYDPQIDTSRPTVNTRSKTDSHVEGQHSSRRFGTKVTAPAKAVFKLVSTHTTCLLWHRTAAWNLGKVASWSTRRHGITPVHSNSTTLMKTMVVVVCYRKRFSTGER